jgi:disulfide bond formation protein DsbB
MKIINLLTSNKNLKFYQLLLFISIASIIFVYFVEFILGQQPCILCTYQRLPYLLLIPVSLMGIRFKHKSFLYLAALLLIIEFGLAFFHVGVEHMIFEEIKGCTTHNENADTIEELRKSIMAAKVASCAQPTFIFMKLSMAEWNFLLTSILCFFTLSALRKNYYDQ